jgi:hypothetical protein
LKWKYKAGNVVMASPALSPNGLLLVSSWDGNLYAFGSWTPTPPLQTWLFDSDFQYDLDDNYGTVEGTGHLSGTATLSAGNLSIEGQITLNGPLPAMIPEVYLIATDGADREFAKQSVDLSGFSYWQTGTNTYNFTGQIPNVIQPINNGHYEAQALITYNTAKYEFFVNTASLINSHYFPLTTPPLKFRIGDWVQTTANLNVREGPGLKYTIISAMPLGTIGQIVGGPVEADGYVWWNVDYAVGVRGWSAENWLELAPPPVPPVPPQPVNIEPADGATDVSLEPIFLSSPPLSDVTSEQIPWDIDGATRVYYQVQITTIFGDYSEPVYDLTSYWLINKYFDFPPSPKSPYVSSGVLDYGTTYYWRIRYKDFRDVWSPWSQETSFKTSPPPPLTCVISVPDEVEVGKSFNIYMGGSLGVDITQVRFLADGSQDGLPTGEWTEWYNWVSSSGDWHAEAKAMKWSFDTRGKKEIWAEIKNATGNISQNHVNICASFGYVILVAGQAEGRSRLGINFNANNAYRVLRNLGFDDEHIFYLNSNRPQDVDEDGDDEVDGYSSRDWFIYAMEWAKQRVNENIPFILYLIGHGYNDPSTTGTFFLDYPGAQGISPTDLNGLLNAFPEQTPMFIGIDACYSGVFITPEDGTISTPNRKRVIVTSAHDDQKKWVGVSGRLYYSDEFWRNLNRGLNIKDAFIKTGDVNHAWLDDNGDAVGHPPNYLEDDGKLAETMYIGRPGVENIPLKPFALADLFSVGQLQVYDSQGRVTGLLNGEIREEIPTSFYDSENEAVMIFDATNTYYYKVIGTDMGIYGLSIVSSKTGNCQTFNATGIPTSSGAVHLYTIDWDALSRGEGGVTVQVDSDGDGIFEYTFTSDSELTRDEFIQQTTPTYTLTITATVGGTTNPSPGMYTYTANSTVQVTAIPDANYIFDHWELDTVNVGSANPYTVLMNNNHTLKAVFTYSPPPPPLSVSISPLSASILIGQSVTFTSTVSGGYTPYSYQWFLNGNPVSGANATSWTFTPTTGGIYYYVYLKVTDAKGNTAQSETARITVATVPVGGYSIPIQLPTTTKPVTLHIALLTIVTALFITIKQKTRRKHRQ